MNHSVFLLYQDLPLVSLSQIWSVFRNSYCLIELTLTFSFVIVCSQVLLVMWFQRKKQEIFINSLVRFSFSNIQPTLSSIKYSIFKFRSYFDSTSHSSLFHYPLITSLWLCCSVVVKLALISADIGGITHRK